MKLLQMHETCWVCDTRETQEIALIPHALELTTLSSIFTLLHTPSDSDLNLVTCEDQSLIQVRHVCSILFLSVPWFNEGRRAGENKSIGTVYKQWAKHKLQNAQFDTMIFCNWS